jgi:hypothetical protein
MTQHVFEVGSDKSTQADQEIAEADDERLSDKGLGTPVARHSRRLSDKVMIAFDHACDQSDIEVAGRLLSVVEVIATERPPHPGNTRRKSLESLVAGYERLWQLRHLKAEDPENLC